MYLTGDIGVGIGYDQWSRAVVTSHTGTQDLRGSQLWHWPVVFAG